MTRIPEVTRAGLDAEGQAIYDRIATTRGALRGPYGVLLHHPALAERVGALGEQLRFHSMLPDADRELAILAAGREAEAPYEWAAHEPIARRAGTRPEAIAIVQDGRATEGLTARELVLVETVRTLFRRHGLTAPEFTRAEAELGRPGLIELVTLAGYYGMIAGILNAFEVDLPAGGTAPFSRPGEVDHLTPPRQGR